MSKICDYNKCNVSIEKDDPCFLVESMGHTYCTLEHAKLDLASHGWTESDINTSIRDYDLLYTSCE